MKDKLLNICAFIVGTLFATMLPIMIISYFTYTEKIVMPILLVILIVCSTPVLFEHIKNN